MERGREMSTGWLGRTKRNRRIKKGVIAMTASLPRSARSRIVVNVGHRWRVKGTTGHEPSRREIEAVVTWASEKGEDVPRRCEIGRATTRMAVVRWSPGGPGGSRTLGRGTLAIDVDAAEPFTPENAIDFAIAWGMSCLLAAVPVSCLWGAACFVTGWGCPGTWQLPTGIAIVGGTTLVGLLTTGPME